MNQLKATVTFFGKIECVTGLHIGGSGGGYEIGGMDNPVIRNPRDGFPYIPGSSLKGKMRSLMEWAEGKVRGDGQIYFTGDVNDPICRIFGAPAEADRMAGPTRLLVRDATPDTATRSMMEDLEARLGLPKVEIKTEVNINRITSKPISGPRPVERVPVGAKFDFEMLYAIYDVDDLAVNDSSLLDKIFLALRLVEDSALGGSGSRGAGQVKFHLGDPLVRKLADYQNGTLAQRPANAALQPLSSFNDTRLTQLRGQLQ